MVSVILRCTSQAEIQYFLDITLDLFYLWQFSPSKHFTGVKIDLELQFTKAAAVLFSPHEHIPDTIMYLAHSQHVDKNCLKVRFLADTITGKYILQIRLVLWSSFEFIV